MRWTRIDDGRDLGYQTGGLSSPHLALYDNGGGLGPARGSGRWSVYVGGYPLARVDTLAEAKRVAEQAIAA